jgi:hypothetical protein
MRDKGYLWSSTFRQIDYFFLYTNKFTSLQNVYRCVQISLQVYKYVYILIYQHVYIFVYIVNEKRLQYFNVYKMYTYNLQFHISEVKQIITYRSKIPF